MLFTPHRPNWLRNWDVLVMGLFFGLMNWLPWDTVLPFALPLYVLANATVYGALWAMAVAEVITRERVNQTYDLLCLALGGAINANWAIYVGTLHRIREAQQGFSTGTLTARLFVLALWVGTLVVSLSQAYSDTRFAGVFLAAILAMTIIFLLDYVQSTLMSGLVGMWAGSSAHNVNDARLWAVIGFLAQQMIVYGAALLALLVLLPGYTAYTEPNSESLTVIIGIPLGIVVLFYVVREILIGTLWRWLVKQFNASNTEFSLQRPS